MKCRFKIDKKVNILFILMMSVLVILSVGCTCNRQEPGQQPSGNNARQATVNIKIDRFENDLFPMNLDSVDAALPLLQSKYGEFFDIFNRVLKLGDTRNPNYAELLKGFITDYYQSLNYTKVQEVYPDVKDLETNLEKAFTIYKSEFPQKKVPHVYTYVSGWNNQIATSDSILAIGLDLFLGRNCEFYTNLQLPVYVRYTMEKEFIVPVAMQEWGKMEFPYNDSQNNVLRNMLYQGKIIYFVKKMLPQAVDTLIFGFRPDQLKWCVNNEKQVWTYLLEKKLLFSSSHQIIMKLTGPAPFTTFFTQESPGRACVWLGYQIIRSYMKKNPEVTLTRLMAENDYQMVLNKSGYKP